MPNLCIRVDDAIFARARERAEREGLDTSKVIRSLLIDWLDGTKTTPVIEHMRTRRLLASLGQLTDEEIDELLERHRKK